MQQRYGVYDVHRVRSCGLPNENSNDLLVRIFRSMEGEFDVGLVRHRIRSRHRDLGEQRQRKNNIGIHRGGCLCALVKGFNINSNGNIRTAFDSDLTSIQIAGIIPRPMNNLDLPNNSNIHKRRTLYFCGRL